jgi:hypothetical protein
MMPRAPRLRRGRAGVSPRFRRAVVHERLRAVLRRAELLELRAGSTTGSRADRGTGEIWNFEAERREGRTTTTARPRDDHDDDDDDATRSRGRTFFSPTSRIAACAELGVSIARGRGAECARADHDD